MPVSLPELLLVEISIVELLGYPVEVELLVAVRVRVLLLLSLARLTVVEHAVEIHLDARVLGLELREHVLDVAHDSL